MSADDYFSIALPTAEDFKAWTRSLFDRAGAALERVSRKFPDLGKTKRADGGELLALAE